MLNIYFKYFIANYEFLSPNSASRKDNRNKYMLLLHPLLQNHKLYIYNLLITQNPISLYKIF